MKRSLTLLTAVPAFTLSALVLSVLSALALLTLAQPGLALADYAFNLDLPETEAEVPLLQLHQFHCTLENTGSDDDIYQVITERSLPPEWAFSLCEGTTCYPPFITEITVNLSAGASTNLDLDVTPLTVEGSGTVTMTIINQNGAGSSVSQVFTIGTPGAQANGFEFEVSDQGAIVNTGTINAFHASLTNTSGNADTYTVSIVKNQPQDWITSICEGSTCYPPFTTEITVELAAGALTNLDFDMTPMSVGEGTVLATITSQNNPGWTETYEFTIITPGLDVLIVDGDLDSDHEIFFQDAVAAHGKTFGTWKREVAGIFSNSEIENFPLVVWAAGEGTGGMQSDDFSALSFLVLNGGGLLLSGQDLASSFCDPSSPHYTNNTLSFFHDVMGVGYVGQSTGAISATGVAGDPITAGLALGLTGGDGAGNNTSPDALDAIDQGSPAMTYNTTDISAVRNEFAQGRSFVLGFNFEAINSETDRNSLMHKALLWLGREASAVGDQIQPLLAGVPYASPNPFNPQTSIKFDVGGDVAVTASVDIFNVRGQKVRSLYRGAVTPGPNSYVWNGQSDSGHPLATGVYLARVNVAGSTETVKMTLVK